MSMEYLSIEDVQQLNKNQDIRNKMIDTLVLEGIPDDRHRQNFLVNLLNGSDAAVFNKAKLKAKSEENQDNKAIVGMMTQLLQRVNKANKDKIREETPALDETYVVDDLVPGEASITNDHSLNYEKFQKDYDNYSGDEEEDEPFEDY